MTESRNRELAPHTVDAVDVVSDPQKRRILLSELREEFGDDFQPEPFSTTDDAWPIVNACLKRDGVRTLLNALRLLGGSSRGWLALQELVDELFPVSPLTPSERRLLEAMLADVTGETLADVLSAPELTPYLGGVEDVVGGVDVLLQLEERVGADPDAAPALIAFLEQAAHRTGGRAYLDFHETIHAIATRLGQQTFALEVCRRILASRSETSHPAAGDLAGSVVSPTLADGTTGSMPLQDVLPTTTTPTVWGGVPPRNRHFAGRVAVLRELKDALRHREHVAVLPLAQQVLGGVGKSQVAIGYAYQNQRDYDLVWWIRPMMSDRSAGHWSR